MPAQVIIQLSAEDSAQLDANIKSRKTPARLLERSKILLLAAKGVPNYEIAKQLGININTVGRWRNRFLKEGYSAITKDRPRGRNHGGKSTEAQMELKEKVIKITTQEKPANAAHWTTRSLAKHLNINHSFINRVWRAAGLKPHLHKF